MYSIKFFENFEVAERSVS